MAKARRVFFSFDYDRDCWRAAQIRNSWVTQGGMQIAGFFDAVQWKEVKKKTPPAIRRWINNQLRGTSGTVVLIGARTSESQWVRYEIQQSCKKGNALLGIYIHQLEDQWGEQTEKVKIPFWN
ncbi:MAG: TIR domain-containing protein [Thermoguttaceae bacterium]|nr:TIR domain-containing protein [Thermoguttaceae bacterium]MDW8037196.1 TIR domain-containing protein [Thermoguttaceae bacterium]